MEHSGGVKYLKFSGIYYAYIFLGLGIIMWIIVARILIVNGNLALDVLNSCETSQSPLIPGASCDGGNGIFPIRLNSSGSCETFL